MGNGSYWVKIQKKKKNSLVSHRTWINPKKESFVLPCSLAWVQSPISGGTADTCDPDVESQLWEDELLRGRCLWISYYDGQVYWQKLLTIGFSVTWTLCIRLDYIPDIWHGHFCKSKMITISSFMWLQRYFLYWCNIQNHFTSPAVKTLLPYPATENT